MYYIGHLKFNSLYKIQFYINKMHFVSPNYTITFVHFKLFVIRILQICTIIVDPVKSIFFLHLASLLVLSIPKLTLLILYACKLYM